VMVRPDVERLQHLVNLFDVALRELRRVSEQWRSSTGYPSTLPSMWGPSVLEPPKEG
jgi:hypothetical protein